MACGNLKVTDCDLKIGREQLSDLKTKSVLAKRREKASPGEGSYAQARFATRQAGKILSLQIGKLFRARS